jgi:hypothetical protein
MLSQARPRPFQFCGQLMGERRLSSTSIFLRSADQDQKIKKASDAQAKASTDGQNLKMCDADHKSRRMEYDMLTGLPVAGHGNW